MRVSRDDVVRYFSADSVLDHYSKAVSNIGLWKSEEVIFRRVFQPKDTLLELGTGTGRIAFGLSEHGYERILGIDLSREMIRKAREINRLLDRGVSFQVEDATDLSFGDGLFEGAIFGFNGLMQIPGRINRVQALREIHRVLVPGGWFVCTTHDRELPNHRKFWIRERKLWNKGEQNPMLLDFGDRYEKTSLGELFIHIPTCNEMRTLFKEAGFRIEADVLRSQLANESQEVREFSDECRFWVVQKRPEGG